MHSKARAELGGEGSIFSAMGAEQNVSRSVSEGEEEDNEKIEWSS